MPSFTRLLASLSTALVFATTSHALTFTSPASNSAIDPTQDIVISWSVSYTDPSVLDLQLSNADTDDITLATGVVTYTGTYTVPAGTIAGSGSGYTLTAVGNGNTLGQVKGLSLGGSSSDDSDSSSASASVTLVSTQTVVPTPASSGDAVQTASIDSVGVTTMSGMLSGSPTVAPSLTQTATGSFVTSATSRTGGGSSSSNSATPTAGSTNTASSQRRLPGDLVLGAAGVLAGVVALLA